MLQSLLHLFLFAGAALASPLLERESSSSTSLLALDVDVDVTSEHVVHFDLVVSEGMYNPDGAKERQVFFHISFDFDLIDIDA